MSELDHRIDTRTLVFLFGLHQEKGPCVGVHAIPKSRAGRLSVGMTVRVTKRAQLDTEGKLSGKWLRSEDRWG